MSVSYQSPQQGEIPVVHRENFTYYEETIDHVVQSVWDHLEFAYVQEIDEYEKNAFLVAPEEFDVSLPWFSNQYENAMVFLPMTMWLETKMSFTIEDNTLVIQDDIHYTTWCVNGYTHDQYSLMERYIKTIIHITETARVIRHVIRVANAPSSALHAALESGGIQPAVPKQPANHECYISFEPIDKTFFECTNPTIQHCYDAASFTEYAKTTDASVQCPYCKTYHMNPQLFTTIPM